MKIFEFAILEGGTKMNWQFFFANGDFCVAS